MKSTGSSDKAMAPTTILVLNRAPSCSLLRSAHSRNAVRTRIRRKTSKEAVTKLETANSAILTRQFPGSNGTSREPNVKTAPKRNVSSAPPIPRLQRCLFSRGLMAKPHFPAAMAGVGTPRSAERADDNRSFLYGRSGREIHCTNVRPLGVDSQTVPECRHSGSFGRRVHGVREVVVHKHRPRKQDGHPRREEWNPRSRGQFRVP